MHPVKSASDYREYRIVVLDNGIKVFLVSDIKPSLPAINGQHVPCSNGVLQHETQSNGILVEDETRLAAAAIYVAAGSFHEPADVGGLAHFLEHMLFMGSEKYPEENGYDSYLKMHGGSSNAYTTDESTVFYFDVQPEYFDGALDMFAHFFISPLLTEDAVDREVKAVDSEFKGRITDDDWRTDQVLRAFAGCKDHPYSRFTHGNKKTLVTIPKEKEIDVMDRLHIFFNNYYNTKQMTLSLCSSVPLDELESMARKYFSGIKSRCNVKLLHNVELEHPFKLNQFHKLFLVTPVEEIHLVKFTWLIPPQQRHYKKKPADYISWLLQHQCNGSVYSYLKEKGYICSMDAYCSSDFTSFSQFCCTTELTERGMDNIEEVIHTVFQYISMIQRRGASQDIFDQIMKISENCFKYQEPDEPCDLVEVMVDQMNFYQDEDYLNGSCVFREYDPELIEEIQNMLTTDGVNIMVLSKKYKEDCENVEKWFKTKYSVKDIPSEWICTDKCTAVNNKLHLPDKNPYISDNFHLHPVDASSYCEYPTIMNSTEKGKVWYKPDRKFLLPKADVNFMLLTPVSQSSYKLMCSHILEYILDFELEELSYEASITELDVSQSSNGKCHSISLCGFSDKLFVLFKDVIDLLSSFHFSENAFNVSKEEMERDYRNSLIKSEELNGTLKQLIMRSVVANPIESLRELVGLTPDLLKEFYKDYFSQMYIESLFQGNITNVEAEGFLSYMYDAFQCKVLPPEKFPEIKTLGLPKGRTVCRHNVFNKKDPNSVIHNYYEIGPPSLRMYNVAALLQHVMEEPVFNILRTKQQLGYTVYCSCEYSEGGILGYSITVETDSDKFTADEIDTKVDDFMKTFYAIVQEETDYDKYVDSYIKLLKQADLSVSDEASRNWSEIYYQDYIFDRRQRSIEMAKQIDKSELLAFMKKFILDRDNVRMLSVQVIGYPSDDDSNEYEEVDNEDGGGDEDEEEEDGEDEEEEDQDEDEEEGEEDEDEEEIEDLHNCEISFIDVVSEQYTRSINDIIKFREECSFYPVSKMLLE